MMKEDIPLMFWGVRGTLPVCGKDKVEYGGHTPCASIFSPEGDLIVIDAGSGMKKLADSLVAKAEIKDKIIHILLTHFHLDHIWGLPFFAPLFSGEYTLIFYSDISSAVVKRHLEKIMSGRLFPVNFSDTPSKKIFKRISPKGFEIGEADILSCPLNHPQGCVAYRINSGGGSVVFATDTEHPEKGVDKRLAAFSEGADIFIYDATFTPEDYKSLRKGWGHSTWLAGTEIAMEAKVKDLYLSHFSPDFSDAHIKDILSQAVKEFPRTHAAKEISECSEEEK